MLGFPLFFHAGSLSVDSLLVFVSCSFFSRSEGSNRKRNMTSLEFFLLSTHSFMYCFLHHSLKHFLACSMLAASLVHPSLGFSQHEHLELTNNVHSRWSIFAGFTRAKILPISFHPFDAELSYILRKWCPSCPPCHDEFLYLASTQNMIISYYV